ncbi:kinase-like domain-containing protein, partial [Thamnocephalis sphaerospora]
GVYHRDLKPENVLVNAYNLPQLIDFGLASTALVHYDHTVGTDAYMAPELCANADYESSSYRCIDAGAADIWSLGITILFILRGALPWLRASPATDSMFATYLAGRASLREAYGISEDAAYLLTCMLDVDPMRRPCVQQISD